MPVTASGDHDHGYATTDHREIEPAYGSLADFDELCLRFGGDLGRGAGFDFIRDEVAVHIGAVAGDDVNHEIGRAHV